MNLADMKDMMTTALVIQSFIRQTCLVPAVGYREKLQGVPVLRGALVHTYKGQYNVTIVLTAIQYNSHNNSTDCFNRGW